MTGRARCVVVMPGVHMDPVTGRAHTACDRPADLSGDGFVYRRPSEPDDFRDVSDDFTREPFWDRGLEPGA